LSALFFPQVITQDINFFPIRNDPIRCPITQSPQDCKVSFPVVTGGNPLLQPDKAKQWSVGAVVAPYSGLSFSVDHFATLLTNRISAPFAIFGQCPDGVNGPTCRFVHRGPVDPNFPNLPGPIVAVDTFLTNAGKSRQLQGRATIHRQIRCSGVAQVVKAEILDAGLVDGVYPGFLDAQRAIAAMAGKYQVSASWPSSFASHAQHLPRLRNEGDHTPLAIFCPLELDMRVVTVEIDVAPA
jgi:hypothetical protein